MSATDSFNTTLPGARKHQLDSYFSIDDILTTQERLPCKFEVDVPRLGFLDPGADSENLASGTKMELPLWLAKAISGRRAMSVSTELPKQYREGYREILSAEASVVDLHKLGPFYYGFGSQLLQFDHPDSPDIAKMLLQTFKDRLRNLMDISQNAYNQDTSKMTARLDQMERKVFQCGQIGLNDFQKWETRETEKLKTSDMVMFHRKRKRVQMEDS